MLRSKLMGWTLINKQHDRTRLGASCKHGKPVLSGILEIETLLIDQSKTLQNRICPTLPKNRDERKAT